MSSLGLAHTDVWDDEIFWCHNETQIISACTYYYAARYAVPFRTVTCYITWFALSELVHPGKIPTFYLIVNIRNKKLFSKPKRSIGVVSKRCSLKRMLTRHAIHLRMTSSTDTICQGSTSYSSRTCNDYKLFLSNSMSKRGFSGCSRPFAVYHVIGHVRKTCTVKSR